MGTWLVLIEYRRQGRGPERDFFLAFLVAPLYFGIAGVQVLVGAEPTLLFNRWLLFIVRLPVVLSLYVLYVRLRRQQQDVRLTWALALFLEAMPDPVIVADQAGQVVLVNSHAEALLGYHAGEMTGRPVEAFMPERLRADHRQHRRRYLEEPRARAMRGAPLMALHKHGTELQVTISLGPLYLEGRLYVVTVLRRAA